MRRYGSLININPSASYQERLLACQRGLSPGLLKPNHIHVCLITITHSEPSSKYAGPIKSIPRQYHNLASTSSSSTSCKPLLSSIAEILCFVSQMFIKIVQITKYFLQITAYFEVLWKKLEKSIKRHYTVKDMMHKISANLFFSAEIKTFIIPRDLRRHYFHLHISRINYEENKSSAL